MNNIPGKNSRLHDGSQIKDAMDLFGAIISICKMDKYTVKEWNDEIILPFLIDPEGWLPVWMLRSDELCISLFGCRIWNTVYKADKDCIEGVRPIDMSDLSLDTVGVDTYKTYPLAENIGIPFSLKFLICKHAFYDSLLISNNEVSIKSIKGFYNGGRPLKSGDLLPLLTEVQLNAIFLGRLTFAMNRQQSFQMQINNLRASEQELHSETKR